MIARLKRIFTSHDLSSNEATFVKTNVKGKHPAIAFKHMCAQIRPVQLTHPFDFYVKLTSY